MVQERVRVQGGGHECQSTVRTIGGQVLQVAWDIRAAGSSGPTHGPCTTSPRDLPDGRKTSVIQTTQIQISGSMERTD